MDATAEDVERWLPAAVYCRGDTGRHGTWMGVHWKHAACEHSLPHRVRSASRHASQLQPAHTMPHTLMISPKPVKPAPGVEWWHPMPRFPVRVAHICHDLLTGQ